MGDQPAQRFRKVTSARLIPPPAPPRVVAVMPRYQVDDTFYDDPAVARAGTAAVGLYFRCGIYVAQHLLDGIVPTEIAAQYGTPEWVTRLTAVGLWETVPGGHYMPHYFAHGNPARDKVLADRKAKSQRQQRWLEKTRNASTSQRRVSRQSNSTSFRASRDGPEDDAHPTSLTGRKGAPARATRDGAGSAPAWTAALPFEPHPYKPGANGTNGACGHCGLPEGNRHHQGTP
jgi:hypothetical protein